MDVSRISQLCRELFFVSFCSKPLQMGIDTHYIIIEIFECLRNINDHEYFDFKDSTTPFVIDCIYTSLGQILSTQTKLFFNDTETNLTLLDYLLEIEQNDCHTCYVNNEAFNCDSHMEDLFTHLNLATLITLAYVINVKNDVTSQELTKYALISLLHDIGKPKTLSLSRCTHLINFPFHEKIGSGILQQLWTPNFGEPFSFEVWEEICRTICVHSKCNYSKCNYSNPNDFNKSNEYVFDGYVQKLLSNEIYSVKENLLYLSFGNYYGSLKNDTLRNDTLKNDSTNMNNHMTKCGSSDSINENVILNNYNPMNIFFSKITEQFNRNNFFTEYGFNNTMLIIRGNDFQEYINPFLDNLECSKLCNTLINFSILETKHSLNLQIQKNGFVILIVDYKDYCQLKHTLSKYVTNTFIISVDVLNNNRSNGAINKFMWLDVSVATNILEELESCKFFPENDTDQLINDTHQLINDTERLILKSNLSFVVTRSENNFIGINELKRQLKIFCQS